MKPFLIFLLFCIEAVLLATYPTAILSHRVLLGAMALILWGVVAWQLLTRDPSTRLPRGLTWFNTSCLYQALILSVAMLG